MPLELQPVLDHLDGSFDESLERLKTLLRIPSISTDPTFKDQTRQAGQHVIEAVQVAFRERAPVGIHGQRPIPGRAA